MIGIAMYITIKSLWKRHKNKSLITRMTGHDWKTVAKIIKEIEEVRKRRFWYASWYARL